MEIKPAINDPSLELMRERMEKVSGKLSLVQIDMSDGVYTPNITYGHAGNEAELEMILAELIKYNLDVEYDLMVDFKTQPLFFDRWLSFISFTKPKRVIYHLGSLSDTQMKKAFDEIDERSTKIFLGLGVTQDVTEAVKKCKDFDFTGIQVMGIEKLGFSGQPFSPRTLIVLEYLKKELPGATLMVDGGVSLSNAPALSTAGATSLASTSALFTSENLEAAIASFLNIDHLVSDDKKI